MKRWGFPAPASSMAYPHKRLVGGVALAIVLAAGAAVLPMWRHVLPSSPSAQPHAPPWIYGNPHARYTVIEYADLECPYCKTYFPVLKAWIDTHPDVNWQWQHRPLPFHDPAATREAWLAECAGRTNGNVDFWRAVAWIYANTRGNGEGWPASVTFPESSPTWKACLENPDVRKAVQAEADTASRAGIDATPTVRLVDRSSGKALVLEGAIDGDALLSAMDWLADSTRANAPWPSTTANLPKRTDDSWSNR